MLIAALALLLIATAPAPPASRQSIEDARGHLAQHRLDDVLFDLQGKHFEGADAPVAAALLGKAALEAQSDPLLSLQFAQLGLKLDPDQPDALEAGARAAYSQKQFDLAEPLADRWVTATHHGSRACLLRAQIALDEGDWQIAADLADPKLATAADKPAATAVHAFAQRELKQRTTELSAMRGLEQALQVAMARAGDKAGSTPRPVVTNSNSVVVYGTSWCGYCKQARAWFRAHQIDFEDKDVEKDQDAVRELARKAEAAHMHPQGVPVIDVHGKLISGFDVKRIEAALE